MILTTFGARLPAHFSRRSLLLLLAIGSTFWVYHRLPNVFFFSDDFELMLTIVDRGVPYFLAQPSGGHLLFTRNAVFTLTYELFGMRAAAFGWLAFATHLINVALLFRVTLAVTGIAELAAVAATLWGTSPLQEGTLGWYAVHGQALAATFLLVVLALVTRRSERSGAVSARECAGWAGLLLIGSTCFGVGIAVAIASPVVIRLMMPKVPRQAALQVVFASLAVVMVVVYGSWVAAYSKFVEPQTAESRVYELAIGGIRAQFSMLGHLLATGLSGLVTGPFNPPDATYVAPPMAWWTLVAFGFVLIGSLRVSEPTVRRRVAALALLTAAVYGLIALARANFYRLSRIPIEDAARMERYHYVATIPIAILLAICIGQIVRALPVPRLVSAVAFSSWFGFMAYSFATSAWRIDEHKNCRDYFVAALREIDAAVDAKPVGAEVYIPNPELPSYFDLFMGYREVPGTAALYAAMYPSDELRGRRVRFVEQSDKRGMFADPKYRRLSRLLVSEGAAAP
jgi:predicted small secreted protein